MPMICDIFMPNTKKETMNISLRALSLAIMAIALLPACKKKCYQKVSVQFINASMHSPYLSYYLQGSKRADFVGYTLNSNSHTADLLPGEPLVIEIKDGTGNVIAGGSYTNWKPNWHYTFVMYDDYATRKTTLLADSVSWPETGKFKVRFIHLSTEAGRVDCVMNTDTIAMDRTYYGTDSTRALGGTITLNAGTYSFLLKNHLTGQNLFSVSGIGIQDNRVLDVYAVGTFSDSIGTPLQFGWSAR